MKKQKTEEKEIGKFILGIRLIQTKEGKIIPKFRTADLNIPKDIIISQLRLFTKMLEERYYPDFRDNVTSKRKMPLEEIKKWEKEMDEFLGLKPWKTLKK